VRRNLDWWLIATLAAAGTVFCVLKAFGIDDTQSFATATGHAQFTADLGSEMTWLAAGVTCFLIGLMALSRIYRRTQARRQRALRRRRLTPLPYGMAVLPPRRAQRRRSVRMREAFLARCGLPAKTGEVFLLPVPPQRLRSER
jgi:hypothetical protein